MRVGIDAAFLGRARGGDETFLVGLIEGLARQRGADDTFPLIVGSGGAPAAVHGDAAFPTLPVPDRRGPRHFAATLPRAIRELRRDGELDLVVAVTHTPLAGATPSVLVLGDLSFVHRPQDYPRSVAARLRLLVPVHARRARAVLVPSEYSRADVVDTFGVDPARVHVVPARVAGAVRTDDPGSSAARASLAARGVVGPYLLYLGNRHPRKNVPRLIRAFRAARAGDPRLAGHRLVLAGGTWFAGDAERDEAGDGPDVVVLDRVSDVERSVLLADAAALAYVSLFEGFGLPPLEAMAYGTPVLTSTSTSLPEVTGGTALLVDPTDDRALTGGVTRILTDSALRDRLRAQGPARAACFDTDRVGAAALAALRSTLGLPTTPVTVPTTPRTPR